MSDTTVYNQYNQRYTSDYNDGEVNNDEDMCDPIGYQPMEAQIMDLLNAGNNLAEWYAQNYPNDGTETDINQTPMPYDMDEMDAIDLSIAVNNRLRQQAKAAADKAAVDKAVADKAATETVSPTVEVKT